MKIKRLFLLAAAGMIISTSTVCPVLADDQSEIVNDQAGNQFGTGYNVNLGGKLLDVCGAGYNVDLADSEADGSAALAGYNVDLTDSKVNGTFFGAGYNIDINNTQVKNNIIAAGCNITIDGNSSATTVRIAGANVSFDGTADYVNISGDSVEINGVINGDAKIEASSITFGDDARIAGNLVISAESEPDTAGKVGGDYSFTRIKSSEEVEAERQAEENSRRSESIGKKIAGVIGGRIYWIAAMFIAAAGLLFLFGKDIDESGVSIRNNAGKQIGFGFLALIGVPMASLILAITVIGLPSAAILLTLYIITLSLSQTFAGLALGRIFLGDKINNPVIASLAGVAILVIVDAVPWVGVLTSLAAAVFTLGYIFIKISGERL